MSYGKTLLAWMAVGVACCGWTASAPNPRLAVSPDALFFRQVGTAPPPAPRDFTVHTRGGGTPGTFAVTESISWLSVSSSGGTGNTTLTASVNTTGLSSGIYSGTITVTADGLTGSPFDVKVTLEILTTPVGGGPPTLLAQPGRLRFKVADDTPTPPSRHVLIQSPSTDSFSWTAVATVLTPAGGKWLKTSPASPANGTGRAMLEVFVDPDGLSNGNYRGQIVVTSGGNSATVSVELEVDTTPGSQGGGPGGGQGGGQGGQGGGHGQGRGPKLLVTPQALNFIVTPGSSQAPEPKELRVRTTGHGNTLNWTATKTVHTPAGETWLTIAPAAGTTPNEITVRANPTGLGPGMYSGTVTVRSGTQTSDVKVFLRILGQRHSTVRVRPKSLHFTATGAGGTISPASLPVSIESDAAGLTFTAARSTASGGNWLNISPTSGTVPKTITASVVAAVATALAPGVYTGKIEVTVSGAAQEVHTVHVTLKVFGPDDTVRLHVEPAALSFVGSQGGANPAAKTVRLRPEGAASIAWTRSVSVATPPGGNWLSVAPASGTATAGGSSTADISAAIGALAQGNYSGTVTFTPTSPAGLSPVQVRVRLVVRRAGTGLEGLSFAKVSASDAAVAPGNLVAFFTEPADGFISQVDAPPNLGVTVLDSEGAPVSGARVVVRSSNGEPDLTLEDVGWGQYEGVFRALFSGPVVLTGFAELGGQAAPAFGVWGDLESGRVPPTVIFQNGAVSAASYAPGPAPLAPGSLVSLFGWSVAADTAAASFLPLPESLGGVSVTVGGVPARLHSVSAERDQINFQVPFRLNGQAQAEIVVNNNTVLSQPETVLLGVTPALFTISADGTGAAAAQHNSDSSAVTNSNPARAGEVIRLYATGLGAVQPPVDDGAAPSGLSLTVGTVTVTIGGRDAAVEFAGLAPDLAGVYQINARVPDGLPVGDAAVVVLVDGTPATGQATLAVR